MIKPSSWIKFPFLSKNCLNYSKLQKMEWNDNIKSANSYILKLVEEAKVFSILNKLLKKAQDASEKSIIQLAKICLYGTKKILKTKNDIYFFSMTYEDEHFNKLEYERTQKLFAAFENLSNCKNPKVHYLYAQLLLKKENLKIKDGIVDKEILEKIKKHFLIAINLGYLDAILVFAESFYQDNPFELSMLQIENLYKKAAKILFQKKYINNAESLFKIANLYFCAKGVPQDFLKAKNLLLKVAKKNYPKAWHLLGDIYFYGLGVKKDVQKAILMYEQSAKLNFVKSRIKLQEIYSQGYAVENNKTKNLSINISRLYEWKDFNIELDWYKKLAFEGNAFAQFEYAENSVKHTRNVFQIICSKRYYFYNKAYEQKFEFASKFFRSEFLLEENVEKKSDIFDFGFNITFLGEEEKKESSIDDTKELAGLSDKELFLYYFSKCKDKNNSSGLENLRLAYMFLIPFSIRIPHEKEAIICFVRAAIKGQDEGYVHLAEIYYDVIFNKEKNMRIQKWDQQYCDSILLFLNNFFTEDRLFYTALLLRTDYEDYLSHSSLDCAIFFYEVLSKKTKYINQANHELAFIYKTHILTKRQDLEKSNFYYTKCIDYIIQKANQETADFIADYTTYLDVGYSDLEMHPNKEFKFCYTAELAECYENGFGVQKDLAKAFELYLKIANCGNTTCMIKIGNMYFNGIGVEKNIAQGINWYKRSAEKNDKAKVFLGDLYFYAKIVDQDYTKAFEYYSTLDYPFSYPDACFNLATMYQKGLGIKKNKKKAKENYLNALYKFQSLQDSQDILEKTAYIIANGLAVKKNKLAAKQILKHKNEKWRCN